MNEDKNTKSGFGLFGNQYTPNMPSTYTGTEGERNDIAIWGEVALNIAPFAVAGKLAKTEKALDAVSTTAASFNAAGKAISPASKILTSTSNAALKIGQDLLEKAISKKQTLTSVEAFKAAIASEGKFKFIKSAGKAGWEVAPIAATVATGAVVANNVKDISTYMNKEEVWEGMTSEGGTIDIAVASGDVKTILNFQQSLYDYNNLSYSVLSSDNSQNTAEDFFWIQQKANEALKNSGTKWTPSNASEVILTDEELNYIYSKYESGGKLYATGANEGELSLAAFGGGLMQDIKDIQAVRVNSTPLFYSSDTGDGTGWYIKSDEYINSIENWMSTKEEYKGKAYTVLSQEERNSITADFQNAEDGQKALLTEQNKLNSEQYKIAGEVDKFKKDANSLGFNISSPSDYNVVNGAIVSTTERDAKGNLKTLAIAGSAEAQKLTEYKATYETNKATYDSVLTGVAGDKADANTDVKTKEAENQWLQNMDVYYYNNGIQIDDSAKQAKAKQLAASGFTAESYKAWEANERKTTSDSLVGLYPQWTEAIKAGSDVRTLATGWLKTLESIYGIDPTQVSLDDPLLAPAISVLNPEGKPMSPTNYASWLRKQDAYFGTEEAANKYAGLSSYLDSKFGI